MRIAVIGPPGSGKTLVATSLAIYYYLAGEAVFVDLGHDKRGSALLKGLVPVSADPSAEAEYVVIDTSPYDEVRADRYIIVLEPTDKHKAEDPRVFTVINKAGRLTLAKNAIPYDPTIHWAMSHGKPPLLVANVKSWRRLASVIKAIAGAPAASANEPVRVRVEKERAYFKIPDPPPAKWRPVEIPVVKLASRLGVAFKRPELWDLCRDAQKPVECYHRLLRISRFKEPYGVLVRALMIGMPVQQVLEEVVPHLEKGNISMARRVIAERYKVVQEVEELVRGHALLQ